MNRTSSGSRDFKFLLKAVAGSYGELELAFRKGRLSVYYRGNSLAVIVFRPADKYRIDIHGRFLEGLDPETRAEFTLTGSYGQVTVDARGAHRTLQRRNVGRLMKAIRDVNHSEELTFEQILIADNPPPARVPAHRPPGHGSPHAPPLGPPRAAATRKRALRVRGHRGQARQERGAERGRRGAAGALRAPRPRRGGRSLRALLREDLRAEAPPRRGRGARSAPAAPRR